MTRIYFNVWNRSTQWGDKIFVKSDCNPSFWIELHTGAKEFPWWSGYTQIDKNVPVSSVKLQCFVQKPDQYLVHENVNFERVIPDNLMKKDRVNFYMAFNGGLCPICETDFTDFEFASKRPVVCEDNHMFHTDCFLGYIKSVLSGGKTVFNCPSLKCPQRISPEVLRGLSPTMYAKYERQLLLNNGAQAYSCPGTNCDFERFGFPQVEKVPDIFACDKCPTQWCSRCTKKAVSSMCICCDANNAALFGMVQDAAEKGRGTRCPQCQVLVYKETDDCTHMTCDCGIVFCYCCGLSEDTVDVDSGWEDQSGTEKMYGHNESFQTETETRCPMYLNYFNEVFVDWPSEYPRAQKWFHKMRARNALLLIKDELSQADWDEIMDMDSELQREVDKYLNFKKGVDKL